MKKMGFLCAVLFFISSCKFTHTDLNHYVGYYDHDKKIKAIEGDQIDNEESGVWNFYSHNGKLIKTGSFASGLQKGLWRYELEGIDSIIEWKQIDTASINFSLPVAFEYYSKESDSSTMSYLNSTTHTLLSISIFNNCTNSFIDDYYNQTTHEFQKKTNILKSKSTNFQSKYGAFFVDDYLLERSDYVNEIQQYMVYKKFVDKKMILITIVNKALYKEQLKFIIGEVFYHIKYKNKRVAFPLDENTFDRML